MAKFLHQEADDTEKDHHANIEDRGATQ